jgi:hypothetical protein
MTTLSMNLATPKGKGHRKPSGEAWSFVSLLTEMFARVEMKPLLQEIKNLRDEIIHSGLSRTAGDEQDRIYEACQDFGREYILRLLNFMGCFFLHSGGETPKCL